MRLMRTLLWQTLMIMTTSVQADPMCKAYWEARKSGLDWMKHPSLNQYDGICASKMVIAKDSYGNCGVHIVTNTNDASGYGTAKISISWFKCNVGGVDLSFGDFVEGSLEEKCVTSCVRCATSTVKCTQVFTPKQ